MNIHSLKKIGNLLCLMLLFTFFSRMVRITASAGNTEANVYDNAGVLVYTADLPSAVTYVNSNSTNAYTIKMTKDANLSSALTITNIAGVTITSDGGPFTLMQTGTTSSGTLTTYRHFSVSGDLALENVILSGTGSTTNYNGGVYVNAGGSFTMNGGAVIKDCYNQYGGGVYVEGNATLTMNAGTINGNVGRTRGGGVYCNAAGGMFTLSDGCFINENGSGSGGGVYMNAGTLIMNGGQINGNTADTYGGGVYVNTGSTLSMNGGEINDNGKAKTINATGFTGPASGGGVYALGTFSMIRGTINNNTARSNGGGICVGTAALFATASGAVSGNAATSGGGIYISSGNTNTTNIRNTEVSGNIASSNGGGVYAGSMIEVHNCTIASNSGNSGGGAVAYGTSSKIVLSGGVIQNNNAKHGGGVHVYGGSLVMESGSITGNTATELGGGVHLSRAVFTTSTFTMNDGTIDGNKAKSGGGVSNENTFTMNGGKISGNVASNLGGGVYVSGHSSLASTFKMTDGIISGNNAVNGGGVYVVGNTYTYLNITRGEISGNGKETTVNETVYGSTSYGGGIYIAAGNSNAIDISNATISNNTSTVKGGGIYNASSGVLTISGGSVSDNMVGSATTNGNGGGIYVTSYGTLKITDTVGVPYITGNHASQNGGGIYTEDTSYTNLSTGASTIFKDNTASIPYKPPANAAVTYANIGFSSVSVSEHPLNNFDINNTSTTKITGFTVDFDSNGGTPVNSQTVDLGGKVIKPADPEKEDFIFAGWFVDHETFKNEWDFEKDTVTRDMTLYAKWTDVPMPTHPSEPTPGPTEPVRPTEPTESVHPPEPTEPTESILPAEPTEPSVPETGSENGIAPWVCMFIISLILIGFLSFILIRKKS